MSDMRMLIAVYELAMIALLQGRGVPDDKIPVVIEYLRGKEIPDTIQETIADIDAAIHAIIPPVTLEIQNYIQEL